MAAPVDTIQAVEIQDVVTDIVTTLVFWGAIGIIGAVGIIALAQVSGVVQQELGPLFRGGSY